MAHKYFGHYLVEKKIISEEQLANALVEQINSLPSIVKIIFDNKLLSAQQILKIISLQADKKVETKQACIELGLWSDSIENSILTYTNQIRPPLGHLLIKHSAIDLTKLTKALDEYLSEKTTEPSVPVNVTPSKTVMAIEFNFNPIDTSFIIEFSDFFSDAKLNEVENIVDMLMNSNIPDDQQLAFVVEVFNLVHTLKGVVTFAKLPLLEKLYERLENCLQKIINNKLAVPAEKITIYSICLKIIVTSKLLRECVRKDRMEKNYYDQNKDHIQLLLNEMNQLIS